MKMRRVLLTKLGGPEALRLVDDEIPVPQPDELRVRVHTAGVAFADVLMRRGAYPNAPKLPFSLGYDVVGTIDAVGDKASAFAIGERIAALTITGGYADYVCIPAESAVRVPPTLTDAVAVSLVLNYGTAFQLLHRAVQVQEGNTVLIHGASGGVGTAMLDFARLAKITAYGTASAAKQDVIEMRGGFALNYQADDVVGQVKRLSRGGVHAAFDHIGAWHLFNSHRALRSSGKLIVYGVASSIRGGRKSRTAMLETILAVGALKALPGKSVGTYAITDEFAKRRSRLNQDLLTVFDLAAQGQLRPLIHGVFPLEQADKAHRLLESSSVRGKLVLCLD